MGKIEAFEVKNDNDKRMNKEFLMVWNLIYSKSMPIILKS
jgi:hypothetical protein